MNQETQKCIKYFNNIIESKNIGESVKVFQEIVWGSNNILPEELSEIFYDLAYDLDYYEPNPILRAKDRSYYGDTRLKKEIKEAQEKIRVLKDSGILK